MMVALADWTLLGTLLLHLLIDLSSGLLPDVGRKNLIRQAAKNNENTREDEEAIVFEFEKTLLNMFGLKRRPTPPSDKQVPRIMQHLYKAHMGDAYEPQDNIMTSWETGFDLPGDDITSKTNTARSFHHIDEDENLEGMPENHIRLRFDVSSIPNHEVIGASELLLHREAVARHINMDDNHIHRINIYEIIKLPDNYKNKVAKMPGGRSQEPITRLLDTRLIDSRNSTWERFDVSLASMKWARNKHEENHGLVVEVVRENDGTEPVGDHKSHVRLRRSLHEEVSNEEWVHGRPKLLTYSHDGKNTNLQRRSRRSSRKKDGNSSKKKRKKRRRRNCQRHNLYVDFKEVDWNTWIVAPHGYDAFFCEGLCEFPLAAHMNATNHAIVQSFVNSVKPDASSTPCCVPTELGSLSMLYYDDQDIVLLKSYREMVVDACGCQ